MNDIINELNSRCWEESQKIQDKKVFDALAQEPITKKLLKAFRANQWKQVGTDRTGVNIFAIYKDGVHRATGSLSQLSDQANRGKTSSRP